MIKMFCDRCGKEIGQNYFTCKFGCKTDDWGMISMAGAVINSNENSRQERVLCNDCIKEIIDFVDNPKTTILDKKIREDIN